MRPVFIAFLVAFVAEFGDKSQLLALAFATRFRARVVLLGIFLAASLLFGVSVAVGSLLGSALPEKPVAVVAGLGFLGFAVWTMLERDGHDRERQGLRGSGVGLVAVSFLLAEFGDKTMLATLALSSRQDPIATWAGAVLGMVAADGVTIAAGRALGSRFPEATMRRISAAAFAVFGVILIAQALI